MADVFAENGYRTGMFGKWHLGDNYPFAPQYRGFNEALCHRGGGVGELPDYWGNSYFDDVYFRNGTPEQCAGYCTDIFFEAALDFIDTNAKQPFFVYLATNAMHSPFIVPEDYARPYIEQGIPEGRAKFYGMIANFDENMGRLRERLAALGIDEDTIIIFTSDHGTAAGYDPSDGSGFNAGMRGGKSSVYDGGHRVNFFLRWKGKLKAGRKLAGLTAHIDVLPTMIDLCGLESDTAFDGISLAVEMRGERDAVPERSIVLQLQPDVPQKWHHTVVLNEWWRLINGSELYNIVTDPGQCRDVAVANPHVVAALRREYDTWWREMQSAFAETVAIPIGTEHENPTLLSARDWHPASGGVPWLQAWIDDISRYANGYWIIDVAAAGSYRFELRTHPREADLPLRATMARLQIGDKSLCKRLSSHNRAAIFDVELGCCECKLQTCLADEAGRQRGAYYVYVEKLNS